jgi:hypothetical protein
MKILKPSRASQQGRSSSTARTGTAYEPPTLRISGEYRRKSQPPVLDSTNVGPLCWDTKSMVSEEKILNEARHNMKTLKSSNPIGGASAFAWRNSSKTITTSARAD